MLHVHYKLRWRLRYEHGEKDATLFVLKRDIAINNEQAMICGILVLHDQYTYLLTHSIFKVTEVGSRPSQPACQEN